MGYRLLVTAVLIVHFGYLAYLVFGGYVAWLWPRTIWLHLVAALWGFAVIGVPLNCPLTAVENWARSAAGEQVPTRGFIDRYIEGVLYPERYTGLLRALAAAAVIGSWVGYLLLRRRARRAAVTGHRPDTAGKSRDSSEGTATV